MAVGATVEGRGVEVGGTNGAGGDEGQLRMQCSGRLQNAYMQQDFLAAMTILGVADSWEWYFGSYVKKARGGEVGRQWCRPPPVRQR